MFDHLLPVLVTPNWLLDQTPETMEREPFPLLDLLKDSLYYPASSFDGSPVKYFGGHFLSFVYVDYGRTRDEFMEDLNNRGFDGYDLVGFRSVTEEQLAPQGWRPTPPTLQDGDPSLYRDWIQEPFCIWSVFRRREGVPERHGPYRFSLLYLCADVVAAFQALYVTNAMAPGAVAIIQPGTGFGGNWTDFRNPERILARSVLRNAGGAPKILLYGGIGPLEGYQQGCWPEYHRHVCTFSTPGGRHISVWQRGT